MTARAAISKPKAIAMAAALVLSGCMSAAPQVSRDAPPQMIVIDTNWGGPTVEQGQWFQAIKRSGLPVCFVRACGSMCTQVLSLGPDRVRTKPTTEWAFHSVGLHSIDLRTGRVISTAVSEQGTRDLVASYPPALRPWFWAEAHGKTGRDFAFKSGAEMIANGFAGEC